MAHAGIIACDLAWPPSQRTVPPSRLPPCRLPSSRLDTVVSNNPELGDRYTHERQRLSRDDERIQRWVEMERIVMAIVLGAVTVGPVTCIPCACVCVCVCV